MRALGVLSKLCMILSSLQRPCMGCTDGNSRYQPSAASSPSLCTSHHASVKLNICTTLHTRPPQPCPYLRLLPVCCRCLPNVQCLVPQRPLPGSGQRPLPRPVLSTPKPGEAHSTATTSPVARKIGEALRRAALPVNPLWHVLACLFPASHPRAEETRRIARLRCCNITDLLHQCRCSHIFAPRQSQNVAVRI